MCDNNIDKIIKDSLAVKQGEETFYITKDNKDGTKEIVYKLKCDIEQAFNVFSFVIREQQKDYRDSNFTIKWRIIRMFDSKTEEQNCQES